MSQSIVLPFAKSLYLADGTLGFPGGKTDLMGVFNSIRPRIYPFVAKGFVVFAQLAGGLGQVPFHIDIRTATTATPVNYMSNTHFLQFQTRDSLVQLSYTVPACTFSQPGLYLVELFCDNQWVADTTLQLL